MAQPKKKEEAQGILSLLDQEIEFIVHNQRMPGGILRSVDRCGFLGVESDTGELLYLPVTKIDAITARKVTLH